MGENVKLGTVSILLCIVIYSYLGLYSLSGKTSYRKISWSLEAARFGFKLFQSLWNLAGTSVALLPMCLSNFRTIRPLHNPISRLRDFTRFGGKTSYRLVNRGPDLICIQIHTLKCTCTGLYWTVPCLYRHLYTGWRYNIGFIQYRVSTAGIEQCHFYQHFVVYQKLYQCCTV